MAKKKTGQLSISQEDQAQAQRVFEQYHQLADKLRLTTERKEAEAILSEIDSMSEAAWFALLKTLAREQSSDAADLILAINELSSLKNVRKEAKRALIQLAGARVYPNWKPPVEQPLATDNQLENGPRRFWKGSVTDSRALGQVQLLLAWEQGEGYEEVQVLGFLLEFWHDGIKDCFSSVMSKRSFENTAARMETQAVGVKIKDCSLAHGRRLILEALAVNKKAGTPPHFEYRRNLALINRLILEAPDLGEDEEEDEVDVEEEDVVDGEKNVIVVGDEDEDYEDEDEDYEDEDEIEYEINGLSPEAVITTFVQAYFEGKHETAYQLLAADSPLREGLSEEAWVESREAWFNAANPGELQPNLVWERPAQKSALWLPNIVSAKRRQAEKVVEAGWSIELDETTEGEALPELPRPTAVYSETDRNWFWTSYTLVQENGEWRIQYMVDEATEALNLPTEELYQKIREHTEPINEITRRHGPTDANAAKYAVELLRNLFQSTNYIDALLARSYDDRALYREAAKRMQLFGFGERSLVYLEQLTQRFEEDRASDLRTMATIQQELSKRFEDEGDDERAERFLELAEEALRESMALAERFETHISLAEVLISGEEKLEEAEDHLLRAKAMIASTDTADEAHIEMHLGEIAMEQKRNEDALIHYQRVTELAPDHVDSWADLGNIYDRLGNLEEAEASFRKAIAIDPSNEDLYFVLSQIFYRHDKLDEAIAIMGEGLSANPDSAILNVYLASMFIESGDYRQADIFLNKAERLDPDLEMVQMFRQVLNELKKVRPAPISFKPGKPKKKHR